MLDALFTVQPPYIVGDYNMEDISSKEEDERDLEEPKNVM